MTWLLPRNAALARHYAENNGPVAFLDESYSMDSHHGATFYLVSAVIVEPDQLSPLRDGLDGHVPDGWWHTTDQLRTESGRDRTRALLAYLAEGRETCVVSFLRKLSPDDKDGETGRRASLCTIFEYLWNRPRDDGGQIGVVILEQRRDMRQRHADRQTRAYAVEQKHCGAAFRLVQVSPGDEHLLWLPDLACSAYRRKLVQGDESYFEEIAQITTVVHVL